MAIIRTVSRDLPVPVIPLPHRMETQCQIRPESPASKHSAPSASAVGAARYQALRLHSSASAERLPIHKEQGTRLSRSNGCHASASKQTDQSPRWARNTSPDVELDSLVHSAIRPTPVGLSTPPCRSPSPHLRASPTQPSVMDGWEGKKKGTGGLRPLLSSSFASA